MQGTENNIATFHGGYSVFAGVVSVQEKETISGEK
jgi:hypothetical protein